jgi:hypothetical protein
MTAVQRLGSALPFVVNWPKDGPGLPAVIRSLPTPVKFIVADVLEHHALHALGAIGTNAVARQDHLPILRFTDKIQVSAFIVHTCLLPFAVAHIKNGNASSSKMHGVAAGERFLDDAPVQNAPHTVRPMGSFAGIVSRPGQVPFADPELKLFLLWLGAWFQFGRRIVLCAGEASQGEDDQAKSPPIPGLRHLPSVLSLPTTVRA